MKIFSKIINGLLSILFLSIAVLFLASLFPDQTGVMIKIVKSGSMEPAIKTGAIVVVRPAVEYRTDDVITFGEDTQEAIPTTHRVISTREESGTTYYTTKGDANEEVDTQETSENNIIGKVFFTVPYAGFVLDFAKQPVGFLFLVALPATLIIFYEGVAMRDEIRKRRENREGGIIPGYLE